MGQRRQNRNDLKRKHVEAALRSGLSVSAAAKHAGVGYAYAKLVKGQME